MQLADTPSSSLNFCSAALRVGPSVPLFLVPLCSQSANQMLTRIHTLPPAQRRDSLAGRALAPARLGRHRRRLAEPPRERHAVAPRRQIGQPGCEARGHWDVARCGSRSEVSSEEASLHLWLFPFSFSFLQKPGKELALTSTAKHPLHALSFLLIDFSCESAPRSSSRPFAKTILPLRHSLTSAVPASLDRTTSGPNNRSIDRLPHGQIASRSPAAPFRSRVTECPHSPSTFGDSYNNPPLPPTASKTSTISACSIT